MNQSEAKFILGAYRPSGRDAGDPQMTAALELTRTDADLDAWFQSELTFDSTLAREVQSTPVPPTLRADLLAGLRLSTPAAETESPRSRGWFRSPWLALAASVVLLAAIAGYWLDLVNRKSAPTASNQTTSDHLEGWQTGAIEMLASLGDGRTRFDKASPDVAALKSWLQDHNAPTPVSLPGPIRNLSSLGCKTLTWHGRPVSIICFDLGNDKAVHLVVIDHRGLPDAPPENSPRYESRGAWITASWSEGDRSMMLLTKGDPRDLEKLLL